LLSEGLFLGAKFRDLFPGYLLAEFIYSELHRRVEHLPGVPGLVEFGD
jgi:transcription antitermination factor NusG